MAFDEDLASRIRMAFLALSREVDERKMFGGLCFMVKGHMTVGISGDNQGAELMVRCGEVRAAASLDNPHARLCDFTGRVMKSILLVKSGGFNTDDQLMAWISLALEFIDTEPPKKKPAKRKPRKNIKADVRRA